MQSVLNQTVGVFSGLLVSFPPSPLGCWPRTGVRPGLLDGRQRRLHGGDLGRHAQGHGRRMVHHRTLGAKAEGAWHTPLRILQHIARDRPPPCSLLKVAAWVPCLPRRDVAWLECCCGCLDGPYPAVSHHHCLNLAATRVGSSPAPRSPWVLVYVLERNARGAPWPGSRMCEYLTFFAATARLAMTVTRPLHDRYTTRARPTRSARSRPPTPRSTASPSWAASERARRRGNPGEPPRLPACLLACLPVRG